MEFRVPAFRGVELALEPAEAGFDLFVGFDGEGVRFGERCVGEGGLDGFADAELAWEERVDFG